jgi:hypothetical protein
MHLAHSYVARQLPILFEYRLDLTLPDRGFQGLVVEGERVGAGVTLGRQTEATAPEARGGELMGGGISQPPI